MVDKSSPADSKNVEECREAQANEVAALQAIFMNDFEEISSTEFKIKLTPYPSQEKNNFSSVVLVVGYTTDYPNSPAVVHLEQSQGLNERQFNELAVLVANQNEVPTNQEKIFDLTQIISEYLQVHNKEPLSLHDEMERRRVVNKSDDIVLDDATAGSVADESEFEEEVGLGLTSIFDDNASEVLSLSDELEVPQIKWEHKNLIGTGPNGEVYAGVNTLTQNPIVIKEIVYESSSSSGDSNDAFEAQCTLMAKEIEAMAHLKHANLVRYLSCEREGNIFRIFQEPIAYSNIKELCYPSSPVPSLRAFPTRSALDEGTIRKYTRQILHALLYLHTHHLAHRNLKCTNILLEEKGEGRILLCDYGGYHRKLYDYLQDVRLSKNAHYYMGHAASSSAGGESASAQELARKDDVYHLALCIISMAGGDEGASGEIVPEHLSRAAKEFINACLKRDAHERPEVATLLKHPFVTQPYTPAAHHLAHATNATVDASPPSPSASDATSASTASSFASSNQTRNNLTSSDTSTASTVPPIPTLARREIIKKDKSANALTSAFAAARDDESSADSASAASSRSSAPIPSRYRQDFEELEVIGRGGFGIVVKARNRLDGRYYAIKKIKIDGSNQALTTKMLREVTTLSRLHHQYVVRYYQAWIERADFTSMAVDGDDEENEEDDEGEGDDEDDEGSDEDVVEDLSGSLATEESEDWFEPSGPPSTSAGMRINNTSPDRIGGDDESSDDEDDEDDDVDDVNDAMSGGRLRLAMRGRHSRGAAIRGAMRSRSGRGRVGGGKKVNRDPQYLYIQMEYCPKKTLRNVIDEGKLDPEDNWFMFRQIIEGLSHIHQQGIIHRDLKPANIFIDDDDSIKIGDFGLATTGATQRASISLPSPSSSSSLSSNPTPVPTSPPPSFSRDDSWVGLDSGGMGGGGEKRKKERSMTGGVGTYFYCCPELLHRGTKHYGVKVDMYSAGIIFFEMWQPFATEMERANILNALRARLEFPIGFEIEHPREAKLIRMLLQHDPDQRPDTLDLLRSDLLPARMEEEILKEAIKTIANPNQGPIFSLLLDRLFSIPPDDHILQTYHYSAAPFSPAQAAVRDSVFSRLRHIFRLHGALAVETPLLLPKHNKISDHAYAQNSAQLLDAGGVLVALPYDLTFPWARYVAQHRVTNAKRYNLGKVYRKSLPGSAPRELWECDFDIVGPPLYHVSHECEVIVTMSQILDEYSQELGPYIIGINHFQLVTAVLEACEVPRTQHTKVCSLLAQKYRTSWAEVAAAIRMEVSARCANMMEPYFAENYPPGSINLQLDRLAKLLARHRTAQLAISELRTLARYLAAVGVLPKTFVDLSLVYHPGYYDGVLYQAILLKGKVGRQGEGGEVVMAGGRYDGLVRMFAQEAANSDGVGGGGGGGERGGGEGRGGEGAAVGAVGVNIAVEKLVSGVMAYEARKGGKPTHSQQHHYQQDLDVVVCSIGSALTEEKISVAAVLWAAHVRADYIPFESTSVEELASVCRERKIPWIITLKDRSYNMRGVVRLRNVETRAEMDLSRKEVAAVILRRNLSKHNGGGKDAGNTGSEEPAQPNTPGGSNTHTHVHTNTHAIVFSNVEIVVLHDETRGRANRKIIIQAQQDMSRVLRALSPNALAKVACVDLPAQVCREVVANFDTTIVNPAPLVKGDRVIQQRVASLKNLLTRWKSFPIVFIYSYRDNKYVALAM